MYNKIAYKLTKEIIQLLVGMVLIQDMEVKRKKCSISEISPFRGNNILHWMWNKRFKTVIILLAFLYRWGANRTPLALLKRVLISLTGLTTPVDCQYLLQLTILSQSAIVV